MLEIVATSCWLVSAPRCVYLLPSRLELDGQLCLSFHYFFSLTKQYTSFIQGQDLCLYNFLYVTGSCVRGLKTQLLLAIQDIPLNLCILFLLVQESGRKKRQHQLRSRWFLCRSAAAVLVRLCPLGGKVISFPKRLSTPMPAGSTWALGRSWVLRWAVLWDRAVEAVLRSSRCRVFLTTLAAWPKLHYLDKN